METISEGERLVKLMLYIKEAGPVSFEAIRKRFPVEYSSKTSNSQSVRRRFERDKRSLQKFGIFLTVDENKRYALDGERSFAAPVDLTDSQTSLIRLVCGSLLEDEGYPFKNELRMVLVKLGDELGVPDLLPQMGNSAFDASNSSSKLPGLDKVRKSITARKRLSFDYCGASGKKSSREVEPFGCFVLKANCYVVAFDLDAEGERCFRLDRMRRIHVNSSSPDSPDFDERTFDASKYYGLPFQFGDEDFEARISFDADEAWRCDSLTMGQGVLETDETRIIWTVPCHDTRALVRWCIEHADDVELIGPAHAVRTFDEGIARALELINKAEQGALQ